MTGLIWSWLSREKLNQCQGARCRKFGPPSWRCIADRGCWLSARSDDRSQPPWRLVPVCVNLEGVLVDAVGHVLVVCVIEHGRRVDGRDDAGLATAVVSRAVFLVACWAGPRAHRRHVTVLAAAVALGQSMLAGGIHDKRRSRGGRALSAIKSDGDEGDDGGDSVHDHWRDLVGE